MTSSVDSSGAGWSGGVATGGTAAATGWDSPPEGQRVLEELTPKVLDLSDHLLARLTPDEAATFTALLSRFVF